MKLRTALLLLVAPPLALACASGGGSAPALGGAASAAEWQALFRPRPTPLQGAPRIAVGELTLSEEKPWALTAPVPAATGLAELVSAGLLRREDIQFVERRRFAEAAERERRGLPRPAGAPPVGTSPGVELLLTGSATPFLFGDSALFNLRLVDPATGRVRTAWRVGIPKGADPAAVARRVTGSLLAALDSLGALPRWADPLAAAAPRVWTASGVPVTAVDAFLNGVAAEDVYDWEGARRAYQRAAALGGFVFFEPPVALARVARLRAGGTLGAS